MKHGILPMAVAALSVASAKSVLPPYTVLCDDARMQYYCTPFDASCGRTLLKQAELDDPRERSEYFLPSLPLLATLIKFQLQS